MCGDPDALEPGLAFQPKRVRAEAGGAEGNRTPDLCSAIAALSHLSYGPAPQGEEAVH